jgi:hypothetical protein
MLPADSPVTHQRIGDSWSSKDKPWGSFRIDNSALDPLKIQAEWTKSAANKVTDIDQVLKCIEEQVEAAERLSRLRAQKPKPVQNSQQPAKAAPTTTPTASQLGVCSKPTPQQNIRVKQEEMAAHRDKEQKPRGTFLSHPEGL